MKETRDFDAKLAAKKLLREGRSGALATLMPGTGDPYCSLVNVATDASGAPLMLLSTLAIHTKNLLADHRVSLMLDERKDGDPLEGARVMLTGSCSKTPDSSVRARIYGAIPPSFRFRRLRSTDRDHAHLAPAGRIVDLASGPRRRLRPRHCSRRDDAIAHWRMPTTPRRGPAATNCSARPTAIGWRRHRSEAPRTTERRVALRLPFPHASPRPSPARG